MWSPRLSQDMSCIAAAGLYRISKALLVFCCVVGPTRAVFLTVGRAAKGDSSNKEQLAAGAPASTASSAPGPAPTPAVIARSAATQEAAATVAAIPSSRASPVPLVESDPGVDDEDNRAVPVITPGGSTLLYVTPETTIRRLREQLQAPGTTVRLFATSAAGNPDPTRELLLHSDDASVGLGSGEARALTAVRTSNFGSFLASPFTLDPLAGAQAVLGTKVCELARTARATLNTKEFVRGGGVKAEDDIDVSDAPDAGQLQEQDTYDVVALTDYDATNDAGGHDCSESDGSSATSTLCEGCSQHDQRCQIIDDVESPPGGPPSSEKGCSRSSSFGSSLSTACSSACSSSGSSAMKRERRRKFLEQQEKAVPSETRACLQLANRWVSFGLNCNDVLLCCDVPFPAEGPAGRRGTLKVRTLLVALDGPHEHGAGVVRGDAAIDRHVSAIRQCRELRLEMFELEENGRPLLSVRRRLRDSVEAESNGWLARAAEGERLW